MKSTSNMRPIYRSKEHRDIISRLTEKNPKTGRAVFSTIKALQCFAAVLGFDHERREKLDRSNVENIEWHIFENTNDTYYIYLIALAEAKNLNILKYNNETATSDNPKSEDMFTIFEEYANGGFHIIRKWLNKNPGDPYGNKAILAGMEKTGYMKMEASEFEDVEF